VDEVREKHNAYMRDYVKKRTAERRAQGYKLLGGECVECGSKENLQFDHRDRRRKEFNLSTAMWHVSWPRFIAEIKKCRLLCQGCHRVYSAQQKSVPHGGGVQGRKNCRCEPCKARKAQYMRLWKMTNKIKGS
jgi:hypothetical protein